MKYRLHSRFIPTFSLLTALFFASIFSAQAYEILRPTNLEDAAYLQRVKDGEALFKANCSSCHAVNRKLTGPALAGMSERWESEDLLIKWIRNNQEVIASGNPYAVALYNEYNQSPMNLYLSFTDDQIISIIDYVNSFDAYTALKEAASAPTGGDGTTAAPVSSAPSKWMLYAMLGFLVLLLLILMQITSKLDRIAKEKQGIEIAEKAPLLNRLLNRRVMGIIAVVLVIFVGYNVVKGAVNLGRSQGYAPEQPIKFSHALHAGQNQIDCKYCHTGVEKSKHAYIPSVTVCMNCHKYVTEGPKYGTEEIDKIYAASGWNKEEQAFTEPAKPVRWVKIHQLPDHVYFNHSQHVKVGGVACETCHGNISEMEVVEQFAPLSMGWCINCHRETNIKFNGSEYYETTFERFHNELEMQQRSGVTVEEIGGTECQKCHY